MPACLQYEKGIKMKGKKLWGLGMAAVMTLSIISGCGASTMGDTKDGTKDSTKDSTQTDVKAGNAADSTKESEAAKESTSGEKDVVTALLPPVSATYQDKINSYVEAFNKENPDVEIQVTTASWEDVTQKLDVQVNAGSPPDIAFIGSDGLSKYVDSGMAVDISKYADEEMMSDFDPDILNYFKNGDGMYGFPAYCEVQCIGGNRQFLEDAGIDWKKVQQEGWSYDEFRESISKGVVKDGDAVSRYGFLFACSGVAAKDYFSIFVRNAGMPSAFDKDLKYAYTSSKMKSYLEDLRALIDDGSMPKELGSIDAGKRWNMFLTGQTMITGKGLSSFEKSAYDNNEKLKNKDSSAVEDSMELDYIVLPVPVFEGGEQQAYGAVDGYICLTGERNPDEAHLKNVAKAAYYLASGERAAQTCQELYLNPICESGRKAYEALTPIENKNEDNTKAVQKLLTQVGEARPDIPAELSANAIKIEDEVIVPKFQGLLAGEVSPEEMYQAIKDAAYERFGEDGCVNN